MVSDTRALLKWVVGEVGGEQGSGPKGVDDLCFHTHGEFSPPPPPPPSSSPSPPLASKLKSQPQAQITVSSLNPRLRAQIPTLWLKSQLHRSYSNLLAQIPAL